MIPAAYTRFRRIIAEHHHQFSVFNVGGAVAIIAAVGVRHRAGNLRGTVGAIVAQEAAVTVHQARHQRGVRGRAGDIAADNAGGVVNVHRFVAVFFHYIFQAAGQGIQRFIPGDALKFTLPRLPTRFIG